MGRPRIKLRNKDQAANYFLARPHTFPKWMRWWLPIAAFFGMAKPYKSQQADSKGRVAMELKGYAYRGNLYVVEKVTWEYPR